MKNEDIHQLTSAPFRRKDHAAAMLGKYMVIHGGIEGSNEIRNTLFYLDT